MLPADDIRVPALGTRKVRQVICNDGDLQIVPATEVAHINETERARINSLWQKEQKHFLLPGKNANPTGRSVPYATTR